MKNNQLLLLCAMSFAAFSFQSAEPAVPAPPSNPALRANSVENPYYHHRVTSKAHIALNVDRMRRWALDNNFELHLYVNKNGQEVYVAGSEAFFKSHDYENYSESGVYTDAGTLDSVKSHELARVAFGKTPSPSH